MTNDARALSVLVAASLLFACTPAPPPLALVGHDGGVRAKNDDPTEHTGDLAQSGPLDLTSVALDMGGVAPGCGAVTELGSCIGTKAEWCQSGAVQTEDCAAAGATCVVDGTGAFCSGGTPDAGTGTTSPACGAVTSDGTCAGATLSYCDGQSKLETVDCTPYGGCVVGTDGYADCKNPPTSP